MRVKQSILFVRPDYHCSFIYRENLRRLGWKADIFVPTEYPKKILFSTENLLRPPHIKGKPSFFKKCINHILLIFWWISFFWKYRYHVYYGRPPAVTFMEERLKLSLIFGQGFVFELFLAKIFGIKLIYLPPGCKDIDTKENFLKLDNGALCNNCGLFNVCNDDENKLNFSRVKRYFDATIGPSQTESSQLRETYIKHKVIDLNLWKPNLKIPKKFKLGSTKNLRILHSSFLRQSGRLWKSRDSKGSPFVHAAVERLKKEGYRVEYFFIENKPSSQMRFFQSQADIVVEQLRAGCWGSTGVECMALGKPVICYLRPSWKEYFLKTFPEYKELPIIEASVNNIYEVLKSLVIDDKLRNEKGKQSRLFAERHFNPDKNTDNFIKLLKEL